MQTSKAVKGSEAHDLGLVDAIVPANELLNAARCWALEIFERRKPWISSLHKTEKLESLGEAREILKFARAQARKQAPNLKHPLVCIDVIEEGIACGPRAGLWKVFIFSSFILPGFLCTCVELRQYFIILIAGRRLMLLKNFCVQTLARAWSTSFLLNEEHQRFVYYFMNF